MSLSELRSKIEQHQAVIGVIGLGYVGLPVACAFAQAGFRVIGVDVIVDRVATINAGRSPIEGDEPGLAPLLAEVVKIGRLCASTDYAVLAQADIILIDVETSVDQNHKPQYRSLKSACRSLGRVMKDGTLVIVESTIAPGTIDRVVRPVLEESSGRRAKSDFYLGVCPERVMPGKLLANLRSMSRVCGGETPETAQTMITLYRQVVGADLDAVDCVTAELVKTAENAYRDVNIAFANELALVCEATGGDFGRVPVNKTHLGVSDCLLAIILMLVLVGCGGIPAPARTAVLIPATPEAEPKADIINVKDWGAKGDGATEDQDAFENAIKALASVGGGGLYLPAGTYILAKDTKGAGGIIELKNVSNIEIYGDSQENTVLRLKPGVNYDLLGDTHVVKLDGSSRVTIRDLTIDGSRKAITAKNEQMHGLYVLNTEGLLVERVRFHQLRGDGVYVIGNKGFTEDVTIRDCWFYDNGRSGIANQGGIRRMFYLRNLFELTSDQDIDLEPTGNRRAPTEIVIYGNVLRHSTNALALTIVGTSSSEPAKYITVSENTITGGGVFVYRVEGMGFTNNVIKNSSSRRSMDIRGPARNIWITRNVIEGAGAEVVHLVYPSVSGIRFAENEVVQTLARGTGVYVEGTGNGIEIVDNDLTGIEGSRGMSAVGIHLRNQMNDGITRYDYTVSGNRISNFLTGILFSTHNVATRFSNVAISNNTFFSSSSNPSQIAGVEFENPNGISTGTDFISNLLVERNTIADWIAPTGAPSDSLPIR